MTTTTITFDATSDTNINAYGAPDWAYMVGSGSAAIVDAANDRVQFTGFASSEIRVRYIGAGTVTAGQDVTCQVNVKAFNAAGPCVRCSAVADTCYVAFINPGGATNEVELRRVVAGVSTTLASWDDGLAAGTHTIRLRAVNNGAQVDLTVQTNTNAAHTFSDTDGARLTSGNPGFFGNTDENFTWLDSWVLDDLLASGVAGDLAAPESGSDVLAATGNVGSNGVRLILRDTDTGALAVNLTGLIVAVRSSSNAATTLYSTTSGTTDESGVYELASSVIGNIGDYAYVTVEKSDHSIGALFRVPVIDLNA